MSNRQEKRKTKREKARKRFKQSSPKKKVGLPQILEDMIQQIDVMAYMVDEQKNESDKIKSILTILVAVADLIEEKGILTHDEIKTQIKKKVRDKGDVIDLTESEDRSTESVDDNESVDGHESELLKTESERSIEDGSNECGHGREPEFSSPPPALGLYGTESIIDGTEQNSKNM